MKTPHPQSDSDQDRELSTGAYSALCGTLDGLEATAEGLPSVRGIAQQGLDLRSPASHRNLQAGSSNRSDAQIRKVLLTLERLFNRKFTVVNGESGEIVQIPSQDLTCDLTRYVPFLSEVARRARPEIIEAVAPLSLLAIPLRHAAMESPLVAIALFVNQAVDNEQQIVAAAHMFGLDCRAAFDWAAENECWPPRVLLQLAVTALENTVQQHQLSRLRKDLDEAVVEARDTFVELGLLHRLAERLDITDGESEFGQQALQWLAEAISADCVAMIPNRKPEDRQFNSGTEKTTDIHIFGPCPIEANQLQDLVQSIDPNGPCKPLRLDQNEIAQLCRGYPTVQELLCVPIENGKRTSGWLLALNHQDAQCQEACRFGSVELRLLSSVGAILGIHSSHSGLSQQQAELLASSVQALTSAIDAKDPYTSGHSDRVARVSVCLAKQLGLSKDHIDTIYLASLLHDIGKIGIEDYVLNKPGELTREEYKHIRQHPQLGYDILKSVRQLDNILPVVLHHHEHWNGNGYPHGLKGTETPLMARIVAVADSFDAMSSNRSYRQSMPEEKVDSILQAGAGSQWDAKIVHAFFEIRDEIRQVVRSSATDHTLKSMSRTV